MNRAPTDQPLPRATPESRGIASAAILAFIDAVEASGHELHSLILVRHGHVVAEGWWDPYRSEAPHVLYSLSKSFASTAAGLAVAEGRLSLDDQVLSFFTEDAPAEPSDNLKAMRLRDLLAMATGHDKDSTPSLAQVGGDNWVKGFLACPVEHAPGTHFVYNSGATYMVSAIVQKVTGERLLDYLTPRLFEPLGIYGATWDRCPRGIDIGGWGLKLKTEDIARFGQLYLQRGLWNGERLLPEEWVEQATSFQVANAGMSNADWRQGYGFQFWRCRHNAYRGDGAFGQYCLVMPEQDAVLAITAGLKDMQGPLDRVWERLLPAMRAEPLADNPAGQQALSARLAALKLPTPVGEPDSPWAAEISGRTYALEPNAHGYESIGFDFGSAAEQSAESSSGHSYGEASATTAPEGRGAVRIRNARGEHRIACGLDGRWMRTETPLHDSHRGAVAAAGAWRDATTFVFRLCFTETPFCPTLACHFDGETVHIDYQANCGFRAEPYPEVVGRS
ncbi:MAG TPA: serine hydrolase [Chthonomonadaceae bacterium]|nr:serine hydrolase [Chthonomonadaceae bacterium]